MSPSPSWSATARLLRRTGFGVTGDEVDAALHLGTSAAAVVASRADTDRGAVATPVPAYDEVAPRELSTPLRLRRAAAIRGQLSDLSRWWLRRMAGVERPFGEKLTLVWHGHFATSAQKVRSASLMLAQNEKLRRGGRGDFRSLAYSMLTDAAMLRWLDGEHNTVRGPNENLSREFLELFALGHADGYTETDVREGARALTGWRIAANGTTTLDPGRRDRGSKTFLGVTGDLDAAGFCDAALAQPGSGGFVLGRLWRQLISTTPPTSEQRDALLAAYGPGRDLSASLVAMLSAGAVAPDSLVVSPVEWLVGAVRALRVPLTDDRVAGGYLAVLRDLGQLPFFPPNVGGWPGGQAWLSTGAAQIRARTAQALTRAGDLSPVTDVPPAERLAATGHLLGIATWSPTSAAALQAVAPDPVALVGLALISPEYLVI